MPPTISDTMPKKGSLTERTISAARQVLAGQRGGIARLSGICRSGRDRLDRLHGPGEFRDQYPGRGEVWLWAALGGVARQSDRDAVPGPLRQARHRHRTEPGGDVPRAVSPAGCLGDVGDQRGCRHGDRSGRVSRRRHRAFAAVPNAAPRRDGRHGGCNLRHPDVRKLRVPARSS